MATLRTVRLTAMSDADLTTHVRSLSAQIDRAQALHAADQTRVQRSAEETLTRAWIAAVSEYRARSLPIESIS